MATMGRIHEWDVNFEPPGLSESANQSLTNNFLSVKSIPSSVRDRPAAGAQRKMRRRKRRR